jgi:HEAT repeat protein
MLKKRRRVLLAVAVMVILGAAIVLSLAPWEPVYQGKPLRFWLQAYRIPPVSGLAPAVIDPDAPSPDEAGKAIRAMGTNAIPTLLRMLQYQEPSLKVSLRDYLTRWFPRLRIRSNYGHERNHQAMMAFSALGSNAAPCAPQLIALYDEHPDPFLRQYIPAVLAAIGPPARQAVPMLLRAVTLTNNVIRVNSVTALGKIHADETAVVPALTNCLRDPYQEVERNAIWALWEFGPKAKAAVPALLQVLRDEKYDPTAAPTRPGHGEAEMVTVDMPPRGFAPFNWGLTSTIKDSAVIALWAIDPDAARKAGIKPPPP